MVNQSGISLRARIGTRTGHGGIQREYRIVGGAACQFGPHEYPLDVGRRVNPAAGPGALAEWLARA
jgi:hypothetical protein